MKILIIGAGNMGKTYGEGIIHSNIIGKKNLFFLERTEAKANALKKISDNPVFVNPGDYVGQMDMIILSVKPQDFQELAASIKGFLREDQLVFSIMAGVKIDSIIQHTGVHKVIRAMPNLPSQVRMGMTVFTTSDAIDKKDLFIAQNLLNTTGKAIYTEDEDLLDAATAISGSGPAYVFYFMNAMIQTAQKMGFSDYESQLLVEQTFLGSVHLLNKNELSCKDWIQKVSSKGGTTEAAVNKFEENSLSEKIFSGMMAALNRSVELNNS